MKKTSILISILLLSSLLMQLPAQYQPNWQSLDQREIPSWWRDAKFGIFIHWGIYSVPAYAPVNEVEGIYEKYAEHYYNRLLGGNKLFLDFHEKHYGKDFSYADFAPMFTAAYFNPNEWADLFKEAGAKYVVLTSKHHDGFCLWPSAYSPRWNSTVTGPKRDLIGALSKATREAGLHFGLYYSLLEWVDEPIVLPHVKRAGRVELLGYEGEIEATLKDGQLTITIPVIPVHRLPCTHAWVFKVNDFKE